jgi:micrococcal nuclease
MKRLRKKLFYLLLSLILSSLALYKPIIQPQIDKQSFQQLATTSNSIIKIDLQSLQPAKVVSVVDGDTIELESGEKLRYIGIDTPETKHPRKGVECFGREASNKNKELVEGKTILMQKDVSETDKFGRLLRYIYLPSPTTSDEALFVNQYLVEQGYAFAVSFPPDIAQNTQFKEAELYAREHNVGLWNICK